jgi:hypothetical protein
MPPHQVQHLKTVERNPHFEDIVINENWQEDCWADDEQLWEALTAEDTSTEAVHVTPSTSGDNNDNTPDEVASSDVSIKKVFGR